MSSRSIERHAETSGAAVKNETPLGLEKLTELPILSWNIHDLMTTKEGPKTEDPDFADIITKSSIFCLQETKQEVFTPNYKCFNSNRPNSRSGGLCIGVHRSIAKHVKVLQTGCPDFQAITMFSEDEASRFTIVNVYDSPENSSYKAKFRNGCKYAGPVATTLDLLLEFRAMNRDLGEILLVGDLNARTGNINPVFEDDDLTGDARVDQKPPSFPVNRADRSSKDMVVNTRGKLLVDFLACTQLTILNGSVLGDVLGEFTSVNYNGCSVVDYMAATPNLYEKVTEFKVGNLTKFSDHKPLICKVQNSTKTVAAEVLLETLEDSPKRYKWDHDDDEGTHYRFLAIQNQPEFKEKIQNISEEECCSKNDVTKLNDSLVKVYQDMADKLTGRVVRSRSTKVSAGMKKKRLRMRPKSAWFDADCIKCKRELNRFAKCYGEDPTNMSKKDTYYEKRRVYRRLIKKKKDDFLAELCQDIEDGKNVNWSRFKKLKDMESKGQKLDVFDMKNFCIFFTKLYGKPSLGENKIKNLKHDMRKQELSSELVEILDSCITLEEVNSCIAATKKKKAVAEDLISNEILKSSGKTLRLAILNVFNQCLNTGTYPWHTSVVTPLHKKGSVYDPNNYRAIAVASNLGKLFASILLKRLITFRSEYNPDTPNQLGFCQNAMTSDHIYTLSTCIEKYVSLHKKRLYSCFVDYAKAFDTVCREALLYKLWKLGIQGKFFNCLEDMYTNSAAKIKLLNKLSEKIDVLCGTEQGHPMSPELFKCFVHQLSEELNELDDLKVPVLNGERITHLLWADDLVLLALTPQSLQMMLNALHAYCLEWGLTVNIAKTAVMVFNRSGRLLRESKSFNYGEIPISPAREYTYLGIVFTLTGSFKIAQANLRQRALRGYFSLKRMINLNHIKKSIIFKLFDALIMPVVSYGCQAWLPYTNMIKGLVTNGKLTLANVAQDPLERVHLSFLKWTMGVNKFTSNTAVWGDSGRYPLAIELSAQVSKYHDRLQQMDLDNNPAFVRHAFAEQKALSLPWYSNIHQGRTRLETTVDQNLSTPPTIKEALQKMFLEQWEKDRHHNRKLGFYNTIKASFGCENYLSMDLTSKQSKKLAQLRTSSHRFNIETGRHGQVRHSNSLNRVCYQCCDEDTVKYLAALPFFEPINEDEVHILRVCPTYNDFRETLSEAAKDCLFNDLTTLFKDRTYILEVAKMLARIDARRFPKKSTESATC